MSVMFSRGCASSKAFMTRSVAPCRFASAHNGVSRWSARATARGQASTKLSTQVQSWWTTASSTGVLPLSSTAPATSLLSCESSASTTARARFAGSTPACAPTAWRTLVDRVALYGTPPQHAKCSGVCDVRSRARMAAGCSFMSPSMISGGAWARAARCNAVWPATVRRMPLTARFAARGFLSFCSMAGSWEVAVESLIVSGSSTDCWRLRRAFRRRAARLSASVCAISAGLLPHKRVARVTRYSVRMSLKSRSVSKASYMRVIESQSCRRAASKTTAWSCSPSTKMPSRRGA
mmetsp:Transcript_11716/g.34578  ORF Transcript_11716/g.34578 Transcript_11716/m.34578 type:complete len:293 (-) Transcript_11716:205-1083(-)